MPSKVIMVSPWRHSFWLVLVSWLFGAMIGGGLAQASDDRGPIVTDVLTGLALGGFDPVAYQLSQAAREGSPRYEAKIAGAVWRFVNAGNRQIFETQRDIYFPRFGGHDPVAVTKGFIAAGDPLLFLLVDNRLYLFQSTENLAAFRADTRRLIARADHLWPRIVEQSRR